MIDATTTTDVLATTFNGAGEILAVAIGATVGGIVALLGLGYGVRAIGEHITGPSFATGTAVGSGGMSWDDIRSEYPADRREAIVNKIREIEARGI